jgi:cobalt-zinc-cadmium efflux system outer membrane protein
MRHHPSPPFPSDWRHFAAGRACALQLAFLLAGACPLLAQRALTLDDVLAAALRANPDLRTARARADSARAEVRVARSYQNPSLSVAPQSPYQYGISAPLDLGPQRVYRVRAARAGAGASDFDLRDAERQLRFAVRQGFFDVLLSDSLRAIARDSRDLFRDLLAADSARVRAGDAPARNLAKSELELAKADAALLQAVASARAARLVLQALMGVPRPDTAFDIYGSLAVRPIPALDAGLPDSAISTRADVEAARARMLSSEESRRYATAELVPVPDLTLVQQRGTPFPNGQYYALGLSAQLPVWNWFSGERSRAAASVEQSRIAEEKTQLAARTEAVIALDQYHAAAELARRLDAGLLARARAALDDSRYAYRAGAISYVDLLDAVRTYGEVRADAANAAHDYWVGAYAVMRATGREIIAP